MKMTGMRKLSRTDGERGAMAKSAPATATVPCCWYWGLLGDQCCRPNGAAEDDCGRAEGGGGGRERAGGEWMKSSIRPGGGGGGWWRGCCLAASHRAQPPGIWTPPIRGHTICGCQWRFHAYTGPSHAIQCRVSPVRAAPWPTLYSYVNNTHWNYIILTYVAMSIIYTTCIMKLWGRRGVISSVMELNLR